jgi:hypothetical protein
VQVASAALPNTQVRHVHAFGGVVLDIGSVARAAIVLHHRLTMRSSGPARTNLPAQSRIPAAQAA